MPHNPEDIDAVIVLDRETPHGISHFRVRSGRVRRALQWLQTNNQYYSDISIDENALARLPQDGDVSQRLRSLPPDDAEGQNEENAGVLAYCHTPKLINE